jgi:diadenosine tetraphosphatase ApaH/serine/threonine PP2A family protein phosphatase
VGVTALISDLHSNLEALTVALRDIDRREVRDVVCLGDVIGYGASPRECLSLVMERCRFTLLGNHEQAAMYYPEDFNPKARAAIDWTRATLNAPDRPRAENFRLWGFLGDLPEVVRDDGALYSHGSPRDPLREYVLPRDVRNAPKMAAIFSRIDRRVSFIGHSHVPGVFTEDGRFVSPTAIEGRFPLPRDGRSLVNVGSVGQPRDGDPRLSYVLYDGESVEFVRLPYDAEAAAARIRATGVLPEFLASRLLSGR